MGTWCGTIRVSITWGSASASPLERGGRLEGWPGCWEMGERPPRAHNLRARMTRVLSAPGKPGSGPIVPNRVPRRARPALATLHLLLSVAGKRTDGAAARRGQEQ